MFRRNIAYLLYALGLITFTFLGQYSGSSLSDTFLSWIIVLGIAMFAANWILLRVTPTTKESMEKERLELLVKELKRYGEIIVVHFSNCDIKTNNYSEEKERYGGKDELTTLSIERDIQMMNVISGDSIKNTKVVEVYQSVLVFKIQHNGKPETFVSRIIPKDRATLLFELDVKKETTLYIDKNDRSRYYFDLDFLNR